jgi:hypothetical protein
LEAARARATASSAVIGALWCTECTAHFPASPDATIADSGRGFGVRVYRRVVVHRVHRTFPRKPGCYHRGFWKRFRVWVEG